tara:strand:+ start:1535 stop:2026 length:492 start_codon:yes stop_codon:yes gene_type:complete
VAAKNNTNVEKETPVVRPRTAARLAAVQAIYQIKMTGGASADIIEEFILFRLPVVNDSLGLGAADVQLFKDLASGTASQLSSLDELIGSALSREASADRLENTLQAILQVGVYELTSSLKTPLEVVISEYVDLTHAFYEKRTADLVNGVLDKLATVRKQKKFG